MIACLWVILEYRKNRKTELQATLPNQGHEDILDDAPPVVAPPMIGAALASTHTTISAQSPAPTSHRSGGTLAAILGGGSCGSPCGSPFPHIVGSRNHRGFVAFLIYSFKDGIPA